MANHVNETFEKRRAAVIADHLRTNPRLRRAGQRELRGRVLRVAQIGLTLVASLIVVKAFLLWTHGHDGYLGLITATSDTAPAGISRILAPDPISQGLATVMELALPERPHHINDLAD